MPGHAAGQLGERGSAVWSAMRSGGSALVAPGGEAPGRPARRLQNPVEACPILCRLDETREPQTTGRARMKAVLLLLLLLL